MTKALTYQEVKRRVGKHGFELLTPEKEYCGNSKGSVKVRSASGYDQVRPIGAFRPTAIQVTCQFDRLKNKGETLAVLAASELTGAFFVREYTPPELKARNYRIDGWAEIRRPDGERFWIALEHNGAQHHTEDTPINQRHSEPATALQAIKDRDQDVELTLGSLPNLVLVTIDDLLVATDLEREVWRIVADRLEQEIGWLREDPDYCARKREIFKRLADGERVLRLSPCWTQQMWQRVDRALQASGHSHVLSVVSVDPLERKVTLQCAIHGVLEPVNVNNVLGSADGVRKGTRCRHCANENSGRSRRLNFEQVTAAAQRAGFRPRFDEADYVNNQTPMQWQCLRNSAHIVEDTLSHIIERGCPHCREEERGQLRRDQEFNAISELIAKRGDELLSSWSEYEDQKSRIRFKCSSCGMVADQAAVKIKLGQRHSCQRHSSAKVSRRKNEFLKLAELVRALGIELVTTEDEYAGNRSRIRYRVAGSERIECAAAYSLRARAKRFEP